MCRFDLKNANINDDNCEKMRSEYRPDVVCAVLSNFLSCCKFIITYALCMLYSSFDVRVTILDCIYMSICDAQNGQ